MKIATNERQYETVLFENCDYYEKGVQIVEKLLKQARYEVTRLTIDTIHAWPFESTQIQFLSQYEQIRINGDEESMNCRLKKVKPGIRRLHLIKLRKNQLSTQFLSMNHFEKCDSLRAVRNFTFTDEQFLSLTAKFISIHSNTITFTGLNPFIKNWANGEIRDDFTFCDVHRDSIFVRGDILEDVKFRRWDENFEHDKRDFCIKFKQRFKAGTYFQIEKNDGSATSATLCIGECGIKFCVTGQLLTQNGKETLVYEIPSQLH